MSTALKCPLCGSWYTMSQEARDHGFFFEPGEVCGNEAMTGPNPHLCSPQHPCQGRLVPVEAEDEEVRRAQAPGTRDL
jgi:hypothetical protein